MSVGVTIIHAAIGAPSPVGSGAGSNHTNPPISSSLNAFKSGYRLGDVATRWFSRAYKSASLKQSVYELRAYTLRMYPGSIAARHIKIMDAVNGWARNYSFSMIALAQALDEWEAERNTSATAPSWHAAVHLRIGDGMSVGRQKPPAVARWAVLGGRIERLHIVTGIHVDYGLTFLNESVDYLRQMRMVLARVGVHATLRLAGSPAHTSDHGWDALRSEHVLSVGKSTAEEADEDFCFMVNANVFIVGRGSFSFAIAEVRNLRDKATWILQNETLGLDGIFPPVPAYLSVLSP